MKIIRQVFSNCQGATAIEYGLIAALIAVASIGAMASMSDKLQGTFNAVSNKMTS